MGVSGSGRAPPCEKASSSHRLEMTSSVTGFVAFHRVFSEGLSHLRGAFVGCKVAVSGHSWLNFSFPSKAGWLGPLWSFLSPQVSSESFHLD